MLFLHGHCAGVGGGLDGVEEGEEDAAEGGFATGGVVPLLQRVDAAALASGANGDGGDAARERNVGVGGTEARFGAEGEVTIDGAESVEEWGVVGKGRGRAISDGFNVEFWWWVRGFLFGRRGDDVVEDQADRCGCGDELRGVGGADVEERRGRLGDGVDGGAAGDVADVDGCLRVGGEFEGGDLREGVAEQEDGVGGPGVCPGVASWAGDGDAEAEAAEGASHDCGAAAAFECDRRDDAIAIGAAFEEMAHAAEVAFALFANVGGEEHRDGRDDVGIAEGRGDGKKARESRGVVADARGVDTGAVFFFDRFDNSASGEDRVQVGG